MVLFHVESHFINLTKLYFYRKLYFMNNIIPNQKSKKDMLLEMTDENKMDGYEKKLFFLQSGNHRPS